MSLTEKRRAWVSKEIAADPELAQQLARLEERGDVRDVMAQLDAHTWSFAWMPSGKLQCACSRTQMREEDWLTPLAARIILEVWYERIAAYVEEQAIDYGALPAGHCFRPRIFYPGYEDDDPAD